MYQILLRGITTMELLNGKTVPVKARPSQDCHKYPESLGGQEQQHQLSLCIIASAITELQALDLVERQLKQPCFLSRGTRTVDIMTQEIEYQQHNTYPNCEALLYVKCQ
ncbi:UNVERIFIED_CONTAM: hypothetical protein FKN15_046561 [Acipenser sinensis]